MKKVLFAIYALGYGGAERALVNLLNELPHDRYEVDLLLFQRKGDFLRQVPAWVNVLETPRPMDRLYGPMKKAGIYLPVKVLGKVLASLFCKTKKAQNAWRWQHFFKHCIPALPGHYDVAVAFSGSEIQYFIADHVDADRRIVFVHNDYRTAKYSAKDDAPYFAQMDEIVSISEKCVDTLREIFPQYAARMSYLENITSSAVVRARAEEFVPPEYGETCVNILSVGRLWPQKGFDMAIDAAAILKEKGVAFRWFVVGEGSLRQELQSQIDARGLAEEFQLLGVRSNPYPYMRRCDVLVQSSRYEGKSVVLDEAKMLCVPIVSTAYPTVKDQVQDGCEGLVVPMSAQGIAEGICRILHESETRQSLVDELAGREYGNQGEVAKYIALLDKN